MEIIFFWIAVWLYILSFLISLAIVSFKKRESATKSWFLFLAAFISLSVYIALRWLKTGHPPVMYQFENALAGSWTISMLFLLITLYFKKLRSIDIIVSPLLALMLGYGLTGYNKPLPLSPPFKSSWLWVHVTFAWVAYGAFTLAAVLAILYILKERRARRGYSEDRFLSRLPGLDEIDDLLLAFILYGFVAQAVNISSGAIWANILWGRYWSWDPVEVWSLLAWLAYGIILHLRLSLGWRGKTIAWLTILALITEIVCFGGIGFVNAPHTLLL